MQLDLNMEININFAYRVVEWFKKIKFELAK